MSIENVDNIEKITLGEFKPKRKYLNFVSAISGRRVRLLRESAFIKGEKLSGMLEGVVFKITILDEGTINFDEIDTEKTDFAMRKRLLDDIDDTETSGYAEKFIVSNLEFMDEDNNKCYLEVEHVKPFNKLKSIFDKPEDPVLSTKGMSILDSLFGNFTQDDENVEKERGITISVEKEVETVKENTTENTTESYLQEQFRKMNESKILELKQRIEDSEKDIARYNAESKNALKHAEELTTKLEVLHTRLESLSPGDEPNGYAFVVSDEQKAEAGLDESSKGIADKIADLMKLKKDVLFNHLTESFYKISIADKNDFTNKELPSEILEKLKTLGLVEGTITVVSNGEFEYRGKLNWHQLTAKLIRKGFEQIPDFDKFAGSNSYEVKTDRTVEDDVIDTTLIPSLPLNEVTTSTKFIQKELKTFDVPTDIVILGEQSDEDCQDFKVTDDESGYEIYVGGKFAESCCCLGFGSVLTVDEYRKWVTLKRADEDDDYIDDLISAHLIEDFVGTIGISAKLEDNTFSNNFNLNDYVCHQFNDYVEVIINLPDGTVLNEIPNHDLSKMVGYNRNVKLDDLGI